MDKSKIGKEGSLDDIDLKMQRESSNKQKIRLATRKIQKNSEPLLSNNSGFIRTNPKLPFGTGPSKSTLAYHQHIVPQASTSSESHSMGLKSPTTSTSSTSSVNSPIRLVKTKKTKTIPKVTLSNQLLKSNAVNSEPDHQKLSVKKSVSKPAPNESMFWTPERISLLNQITPDVTLRTALITAGNNYFKSKTKVKTKPIASAATKPPTKQKVTTTVRISKNQLTQSLENPVQLSASTATAKQIAKPKTRKVINAAGGTGKSRKLPPKPKAKVSFKPGPKKSPVKKSEFNSARKVPMAHQSSLPMSAMEENQRKNAIETKTKIDQLNISSTPSRNQGSRNVHERHQAGFDNLKNLARIQ